MEVEVNYFAVVLATFSTMVVGSVWYTPKVFGSTWMRLAGLKQKELEKNGMAPIFITLVVSFITAYVLAHVTFLSNKFFGNSFLYDALMTSFWMWLGFVAARIITHDSFEGRRKQLTFLNVTHELVTFLVMGLIIGLIGL